MKRTLSILAILQVLFASTALWTQTKAASVPPAKGSSVTLEYYDDEQQLQVFNADGFEYGSIFLGMELLPGDRIQTKQTSVEMRLNPNGTIIKVAPNTNFQITSLASGNAASNAFNILAGKIRTVAAKSTGNTYQFTTPTATAGVRGTDFGLEVSPGQTDRLVVREGAVDFLNSATGQSISVSDGQAADTFAQTFQATQLSTQDLAAFFGGLDFSKLDPNQVPGQAKTAASAQSGNSDSNSASGPSPEPSPSASPSGDNAASTVAKPNPLNDAALDAFKKVLGIEIGSITVDDKTYGKLIIQPKIDTKNFKAEFYLPIIYQSDLFNPHDWYRPLGNNEWSFGTDQGGLALPIVTDIFRDLALKIHFIQLFNPGDPFFLQVGNVPSMTLGHGFLIGNYADDLDFPAVRRLGVSLGVDTGHIGFEALVNDVAKPELFGTRFLWRPAYPTFKLGIGISAALDIDPLGNAPDLAGFAFAKAIDPKILTLALDLDLPIFASDVFNLKAFADFGGLVPYFGDNSSNFDSGLQFSSFINAQLRPTLAINFHNFGFETGVMGKVFIVDYRLQYQYSVGSFRPDYFDSTYDRTRAVWAAQLVQNFADGSADSNAVQNMGVYGSAAANLFNFVRIGAAYKWPWSVDANGKLLGAQALLQNPDDFSVSIGFAQDALPYGIGFSVSYDRSHFAEIFTDPDNYQFFDAFGTFKGQVEIPIGNFLKIRVQVGTAVRYDSSGNIVYGSNGKPEIAPSFTVESVF